MRAAVGHFTRVTQKFRFYFSSGVIYAVTLAFGWYVLRPLPSLSHTHTIALTRSAQKPFVPVKPQVVTISGRPIRIVIPGSSLDLTVDPGYYNSDTGEWTLSGYHAQFAMSSTLANDQGGETFIYGHNNNYVFGALRHNTPAVGAEAFIYTDNGHIFAYKFTDAKSVQPDDVSVLNYAGAPILVIQTCTGSLNEWRTMYHFDFERVVQ